VEGIDRMTLSKIARKIKEIRLPLMPSLKPLNAVVVFLMISISIFIFAGGLYDIMERPISVLPTPSQPVFYYPGMTDQTMTESLGFMLFLIIGVLGGYISFRSARYVYRPREGRLYILIGLAMLIIAFIGCEQLLSIKGV
jgi:hypothetical protein